MSYPRGQLRWYPLPGGRAHVVFEDFTGVPIYCGSIPHEWLTNVTEKAHGASVTMGRVSDCDHGGTHRNPRNVWTGELVPTTP